MTILERLVERKWGRGVRKPKSIHLYKKSTNSVSNVSIRQYQHKHTMSNMKVRTRRTSSNEFKFNAKKWERNLPFFKL